MKKYMISIAAISMAAIMTACGTSASSDVLSIKEQGMFSAGGTVTEAVAGEYDATMN